MGVFLGAVLVAAALLGGCAGWLDTPYNPQQACDSVGGTLLSDGRCLGGGM